MIPSQFGSIVGEQGILSLCSSDAQAAQGAAFLDAAAEELLKRDGSLEPRVVLDVEMDLDSMEFKIVGARMADKILATLCCLERYLELIVTLDAGELDDYVKKFTEANGLAVQGEGVVQMQQVYSLAYSIKVATSNLRGWTGFICGHKLPLSPKEDFSAILRELFENGRERPSVAESSGAKATPKKSAKRAKGASATKSGKKGVH